MAQPKSNNLLAQIPNLLIYGVYRLIEFVIWLTPLTLCAMVGSFLGLLVYLVLPRYRAIAMKNLEIAFGREKDLAWRRKVCWQHFSSMGRNFLCGLKLPLMSEEAILKRLSVENAEPVHAMIQRGVSVIYGIAHSSCWELLTQIPSVLSPGKRPASIFQALSNPFLDAHVRRRREKLGYTLFDRSEGFSAPLKHLRVEGGCLGVLWDQHAGDKGIWCPFFDRLASTTSLPALLATRANLPLVPLNVMDAGWGRWRIQFGEPLGGVDHKLSVDQMTAQGNLRLEEFIRWAPHNWFWVHNRWKTPNPGFLLSQYRRGVVFPEGYDQSKLQPFRVIVRSPNWLGDACMAFPAVRALKQTRPDLELTIFAPSKLADLWKSLPEVDRIVTKESKEGLFSVAKSLKLSGPFDAGILLTNSTRSTLEFWLSGIPRLVGYHGSLRAKLLHQKVPEKKKVGAPEHHADRYLRIMGQCGALVNDESALAPVQPRTSAGSHRIGICAGAEYGQAKRWPMERFAEVAKRVSSLRPELEWQLYGAPNEREFGVQLSQMMGSLPHFNWVGKTNLTELIEHLRNCRLLVTNDTGTMHLAAALGVPTVSIFGSTEPVLTGPLGTHHQIVRHHVECSPCFKRECPFGHYNCMTGISPGRVEREILKTI